MKRKGDTYCQRPREAGRKSVDVPLIRIKKWEDEIRPRIQLLHFDPNRYNFLAIT